MFSLLAVLLGYATAAPSDDPAGRSAVVVGYGTEHVMGPGKVKLTFTRDGSWRDLTPLWNGEQPLFSEGGLLLFARGSDGRLKVVLNTAESGVRVNENASRIRVSAEGARGGFRAPSPYPDDDGDGRVDEDRLDGSDNDGDGEIDEDFAAIGDEMITMCYFAPGFDDSRAQLAFHQEAYAWALPHIDATIMASLWIRNIGSESIEDVRLAAFMEKEGPFYFSNWLVSLPGASGAAPARAVVCEDLQGTSLGMAVFPGGSFDGVSWTGGILEGTEDAGRALLDRMDGSASGGSPAGEVGAAAPARNIPDALVVKTKESRVGGRALVYQASPNLGSLPPGEEMRLDMAFFAARDRINVESAAINAVKTFVGDGVNRHLPPPVSVTPRVVWGTYVPLEPDETGTSRVAIDFETLSEDPVTPEKISRFSGVEAGTVEPVELEPGVVRLVLQGDIARKAIQMGERIVLKGRLENGEFFEAILKPQEGAVGVTRTVDDAELFWKTEGRLEFKLLSISPNPFRDATLIYYEIPGVIDQPDGPRIESREPLEVSVKVYSVTGRLVSMLVDDVVSPGTYTTQWRAVDDHGNAAASGVYYVRLQIGKKYLTERLILLK